MSKIFITLFHTLIPSIYEKFRILFGRIFSINTDQLSPNLVGRLGKMRCRRFITCIQFIPSIRPGQANNGVTEKGCALHAVTHVSLNTPSQGRSAHRKGDQERSNDKNSN